MAYRSPVLIQMEKEKFQATKWENRIFCVFFLGTSMACFAVFVVACVDWLA